MLARYFYKVLRRLFFNAHLRGLSNLRGGEPVILVANHAGAFGPVSIITSMPTPAYPWVAHEVTDLATVTPRIQAEFCEAELKLKPPFSGMLARFIGRICVALMKDIGAIPVYQKSKDIRTTVMRSLSLLQQGKSILVFAEDSSRKVNDVLCEFCTGFIHVAKLYYEATRQAVQFLPVAVNRKMHRIRVGSPIRYDATNPFGREKLRIKQELERSVYDLYMELESAR
jgi:1-acyl-sn-glycerol-3-phosphate acyltransferase